MSQIQAQRRKSYWLYIIFAWFFATLYTIVTDGFDDPFPFINTSIIGIVIGFLVAVFELELARHFQRQLTFIQILSFRSTLYLLFITIIIFLETALARTFKFDLTFREVLRSEEFQHYLLQEDFVYAIFYAFGIIVMFNFTRQVVKKLGHGVFLNFITGRYVKPVIENRILMFISIQNIGQIINRLGRLRFHSFLNEFVSDITESIISYKGRIYEYVDDQVIVVWDPKHGLQNINCIRAFFEAKDRLLEQEEKYIREFGVFPRITASLHRGNLVHGELGYVKSAIVYSGDVMNTTSRLLDACHVNSKEILVSKDLIRDIDFPKQFQPHFCGSFTPRGRHGKIDIYTIIKADLQPA